MNKFIRKFRDSNNYVVFGFFLIIFILLDQLIKNWIFSSGVSLGNKWLGVAEFRNYSGPFGLAVTNKLALSFAVIAGIAYGVLAFKIQSKKSPRMYLPHALVLAGAISNIYDRLAFGAGRDYVMLILGVFNLADFYIFLGAVLLII